MTEDEYLAAWRASLKAARAKEHKEKNRGREMLTDLPGQVHDILLEALKAKCIQNGSIVP